MRRAAIEAFAESGYGGSSTRQIAKRLNMSATAMYPHYRSKEELLYAIALERFCQRVIEEVQSTADSCSGGYHDCYLKLFDLMRKRDRNWREPLTTCGAGPLAE